MKKNIKPAAPVQAAAAENRDLFMTLLRDSLRSVAEPTAHRRDVYAGFDAGGGEEVPEIMVRELRERQAAACGLKAFLGVLAQ